MRQTSRKLKTRINEDKNDINKRAITCLSFLNIDYNLNEHNEHNFNEHKNFR